MKSKVWLKNEKNIISIVASIKSAKLGCSTIRRTSFSYWAQLDPKILQKHPIFRGGPVPPKNDYFSKIFVPRDLSTRKPPVYEFWAIFLKIEILLVINLSRKFQKTANVWTANVSPRTVLLISWPFQSILFQLLCR